MDNQNITPKMRHAYNIMVKNRFLKHDALNLKVMSKELSDSKLVSLFEDLYKNSLKVEEYLQQRCEAVSFVEFSKKK